MSNNNYPVDYNVAEATTARAMVNNNDEVAVNKDFYARLIDIAHESFGRTSYNQIKMELIARLDNTRDLSNLVREAKEFIEEREFVDAVTAEKERIEYAKL